MEEEWRPIPEWESFYEVSSWGRVRSLPGYKRAGRILESRPPSSRYPTVGLSANGVRKNFRVHRLVALAFLGPPPPDRPQVLHADDDPLNNHLDNLRYGTTQENRLDSVANGRHHMSRKTHCVRGHEFTKENTRLSHEGRHRACKTCEKVHAQKYLKTDRKVA